jgi:hypothetical protein
LRFSRISFFHLLSWKPRLFLPLTHHNSVLNFLQMQTAKWNPFNIKFCSHHEKGELFAVLRKWNIL